MPVSKQAWLKLPKAQRGNLNYQQYVQWANKKTAQRIKAKRDKAAAAAALNSFAGVDFSALNPVSNAALLRQARQSVTSQTQPIITEIQNAIARQRKAGIADINRATSTAVKAVTPLPGQIGQDYNQALQQVGTTDQFLANFVRGQGQETQQNLGAELAKSGLPTTGLNVAGLGQGAGAELAGYGSIEQSRLAGERANQVAYTQRLPAWYKAMGAQNVGTVSRQYADALSSQIGQVTQNVPSLVNQTYQNLLEREYNKAVARIGFQMDIGKTVAGSKIGAAKAAAKSQNPKINVGISNKRNDGHAYDSGGNPIPGQTWPITPPKGGTTGDKFKGAMAKAQKEALPIATKIHQDMMARLGTRTAPPPLPANATPAQRKAYANAVAGGGTVPSGGARANIIAHARENALNQIVAFYHNRFPNLSQKQLDSVAAGTLASAGWARAAHQLAPGEYAAPPPSPQEAKTAFAQDVFGYAKRVKKNIADYNQAVGLMSRYILRSAKRNGITMTAAQARDSAVNYWLPRLGIQKSPKPGKPPVGVKGPVGQTSGAPAGPVGPAG